MRRKPYAACRGSILFIILLAVVLFVALAFAFSYGYRTQGSSISREQARIQAAQIISFAASIEQAVSQKLNANQCKQENIRFSEPSLPSAYLTGSETTANSLCYVFTTEGQRIPYVEPPAIAMEPTMTSQPDFGYYTFSGANTVQNVGTPGTADLVVFLPYIRDEVCQQLNSLSNINLPDGAPVLDADGILAVGASAYFNGTFGTSEQIDAAGKSTGCIVTNDVGNGAGTYNVFFHVLSQR